MIKFFKDAISEIHNVTWPSKKHTKHISTVAIVFTFSCAIFIGFVDYGFDKAVKTVTFSNVLINQNSKTSSNAPVDDKVKVSDIKVNTVDGKDTSIKITDEKSEKSKNTEKK